MQKITAQLEAQAQQANQHSTPIASTGTLNAPHPESAPNRMTTITPTQVQTPNLQVNPAGPTTGGARRWFLTPNRPALDLIAGSGQGHRLSERLGDERNGPWGHSHSQKTDDSLRIGL